MPPTLLSPLILFCLAAWAFSSPIISELQIKNQATLFDEDGDAPDWIEIHNPDPQPLNLNGYRLIQSGITWTFPSVDLPPAGYLVVFASGKDRSVIGKPLHTSFSLKKGENLAFLMPAGPNLDGPEAVLSSIESLPEIPEFTSYGLADDRVEQVLIGPEAPIRWAWESNPTSSARPNWTLPEYSTRLWPVGKNGLLWSRKVPGFWLEAYRMRRKPQSGSEFALMRGRPGELLFQDAWAFPTLNFATGKDGVLNFGNDRIFPRPENVPEKESLAYHASGIFTAVVGGTWTLSIGSASGSDQPIYRIQIGDAVVESNKGGGIIIDPLAADKIRPPFPGPDTSGLRTLTLPKAGTYAISVWWVQPAGADVGFELSAAAGEQTSFSSKFALLGTSRRAVSHQLQTANAPLFATKATASRANSARGLITRTRFTAPTNPDSTLQLRLHRADGFRAWIDGVLVAQRNSSLGNNRAIRALSQQEKEAELVVNLPKLPGLNLADGKQHLLTIQTITSPGQKSLMKSRHILVEKSGPVTTPWAYFAKPSPGEPNSAGLAGISSEPDVSTRRGVYSAPFEVSLTSTNPAATIFYSLDGNPVRQDRGTLYRGPISIGKSTILQAYCVEPGKLPSHTILHSYLISQNQGQQTPDGLPPSWGTNPADYEFDAPAVTGKEAELDQSLRSIPSLSIVLPSEHLFGESGIHANPENRGPLSAFPASVEWIYPNNGVNWREKATIRIKGEASRGGYFLKHGFRLDFGGGAGDLRRPMMGGSSRKRYNTLMLHGSFVDNCFTLGAKAQYVRDLWVRDSLRKMGHPAAHGEYYHLYLNGLYWGLYHAGERCDAQWCAQYFGGNPSDWNVIDSDGEIDGSKTEWNQLMEFVRAAEPTKQNYLHVAARFDLVSFCDYMLVNLYAANTDWPGHNWYAAMDRRSQVWRFITWDAEYSFDRPSTNSIVDPEFGLGGDPGDLFRFLTRFPEFLGLLGDRVNRHTRTGGVLSPVVTEETWMRRANVVDGAIFAEYARWGDRGTGIDGNPQRITRTDWIDELTRLRTTWFPARSKILARQLRAAGMIPEVQPAVISPPGGYVADGTVVSIANTGSNAVLYYTLDGSDPMGSDGQPAPGAISYTGSFSITPPLSVKCRGWYDNEASPLTEAHFFTGTDPRGLYFSEIHFKPAIGSEEFVEIINTNPLARNLAGVQLRGAVSFTFTEGTILAPGEAAVVARDAVAFGARYPGVPLAGDYAGALADEGETIQLWDPVLGVLDEVHFRPYEPWPAELGSMHRSQYGNGSPEEWSGGVPTPGSPPPHRRSAPATLALEPEPPLYLEIGDHDGDSNRLPLTFPVSPAFRYEVQFSESLAHDWTAVLRLPAPQQEELRREWLPVTKPRGFYRVLRIRE